LNNYIRKNQNFINYFFSKGYKTILFLLPLLALILFVTSVLVAILISKLNIDITTLEYIASLNPNELMDYINNGGEWMYSFSFMMLMLIIYLLFFLMMFYNSQFNLVKKSLKDEKIRIKDSFKFMVFNFKRFLILYILVMVILNILLAFFIGLILPSIYSGAIIAAIITYYFTALLTNNRKIDLSILLTGIILYLFFTFINLQIIVSLFLPIYFYYFALENVDN